MVAQQVIPDLLKRSGEASTIVSRSLKTWGTSESALAEMVAHRLDALDAAGNPTIAFLARGHRRPRRAHHREGRDRRRGARARRRRRGGAARDPRRPRVRRRRRDDGARRARAAAEPRAGRSASPNRSPAGSSARGSSTCPARATCSAGTIASYATDVKRSVLGVTAENVVSEEAAREMAEGRAARARRRRRHRGHGCRGADRAGRRRGRHGVLRDRVPGPADRGGHRRGCPATASASASSRRSRC